MRHWLRKMMPDHATVNENRWLAPFCSSLLHPRLWHLNRRSAAGGVAAGLFCGLIPGPFQMLGAALCAIVFRVNLPLALFTTLYTNPFTIVPLYLVAHGLGQWLLGPTAPFTPPPEQGHDSLVTWINHLLAWLEQLGTPLLLGLPLLATALALGGYFAVRLAWRAHLVWHQRQRRVRAAPPTPRTPLS
jgi:uncharacterized protein (DUF2062 family)